MRQPLSLIFDPKDPTIDVRVRKAVGSLVERGVLGIGYSKGHACYHFEEDFNRALSRFEAEFNGDRVKAVVWAVGLAYPGWAESRQKDLAERAKVVLMFLKLRDGQADKAP